MRKYIMVEGIAGLLVGMANGARAVVGQVPVAAKLDEKTQQLIQPAEHHMRFRPERVCVPLATSYTKAIARGMLKQYGSAVVAESAAQAAEMLKGAPLYTPPGMHWEGDKLKPGMPAPTTSKPARKRGKGSSK